MSANLHARSATARALLLSTLLASPLAASSTSEPGSLFEALSASPDPLATSVPLGFTLGSADAGPSGECGCTTCAGRPDAHAPIGVMGDHVHEAGGWMVSVRAMRMRMQGLRDGTRDLAPEDVLPPPAPPASFMVAPLSMDMTMLMASVMFAPSDRLTLMAMVPYVWNEMDHVTGTGTEFTTRSSGVGDLRLAGLVPVASFDEGAQRVHLNLGLSVPTGSIDERDDTPATTNAPLPYPMQIGTGTWDLLPGVTYTGHAGEWSWGAQVAGRFHLGENDRDYRRGDRGEATVWGACRLAPRLSGSLRLAGQTVGNIEGADPRLNPLMVPTADPKRQGGERLDVLLGLNALAGAGHRAAIEVGLPVHQDLDGPQLETDWTLTLGWQVSW